VDFIDSTTLKIFLSIRKEAEQATTGQEATNLETKFRSK
jgi:hypothetical protein